MTNFTLETSFSSRNRFESILKFTKNFKTTIISRRLKLYKSLVIRIKLY